MTGAILLLTRPAMIMRSDWRGEPRKTSAPKREMSKREADIDIISMAQQASPKDIGQMEFLRPQLMTQSTEVIMIPSRWASRTIVSLSSRAKSSAGPEAIGGLGVVIGFGFIFACRRRGCGGTGTGRLTNWYTWYLVSSGNQTDTVTRSLAEVHGSVSTAHVSFWRRAFAFAGPAYLVSVGYMDPGNWITDLSGGASFGYRLLWV